MIFTFAAKVTEENIPHIIEEAARWNLNVTDDLDGILEDPSLTGDHYAILSFNQTLIGPAEPTFFTMWHKDFLFNYRTVGEIQGPCFRQVQKI
jgi:hypothetical protein